MLESTLGYREPASADWRICPTSFEPRQRAGDGASQYTSVHFTETLLLAGLRPSIGTVGDALDNALA
jgi:hypothetical protein